MCRRYALWLRETLSLLLKVLGSVPMALHCRLRLSRPIAVLQVRNKQCLSHRSCLGQWSTSQLNWSWNWSLTLS